jgi:hypothetical protein
MRISCNMFLSISISIIVWPLLGCTPPSARISSTQPSVIPTPIDLATIRNRSGLESFSMRRNHGIRYFWYASKSEISILDVFDASGGCDFRVVARGTRTLDANREKNLRSIFGDITQNAKSVSIDDIRRKLGVELVGRKTGDDTLMFEWESGNLMLHVQSSDAGDTASHAAIMQGWGPDATYGTGRQ